MNESRTRCRFRLGSNTTLRNHITHPHCEVIKAQKNQNSEAEQTSMARDGSVFRVSGSYMCVTAHWIEPGTWQMIKWVISFEEFSSPHTGHALFKMLIKVLTNFNLEDKVMSITLDNASNNTSAMDKLKLKYDPPIRGFWKENETMFPVRSRMARDLISVQTFSVASESAFLTSGRVLSIRRTRLTSACLEMCICLKDHLDAKERKQDKCPLEIPLDFEENVFDDEVQRNEAVPLSDEEIALVASSEGTLSPGGSRRRIKEPRLRGVLTRLEYLSEDADEEIQMEGPPSGDILRLQRTNEEKIQLKGSEEEQNEKKRKERKFPKEICVQITGIMNLLPRKSIIRCSI
nr:zinc finger BED domain-containing protein RICESLEEPER 2 [Tanacetum cinerariifolium]